MIEAGETVTIKSGRQAILADTIVDGDLIIEAGADVFVPSGAGFSDLDQRIDTKLDKDFSSFAVKPTPVNTDNFAIQEVGGLLKKLSWANLKATLFDGSFSTTTNGYVKLPTIMGGFIFQWGQAVTSASGQASFVFPIAFPTTIYQANATYFVNGLFPHICVLFSQAWGNAAISALVMDSSGVGVAGAQVKFFAVGR